MAGQAALFIENPGDLNPVVGWVDLQHLDQREGVLDQKGNAILASMTTHHIADPDDWWVVHRYVWVRKLLASTWYFVAICVQPTHLTQSRDDKSLVGCPLVRMGANAIGLSMVYCGDLCSANPPYPKRMRHAASVTY